MSQWVHKVCGGPIDSELWASDSEQDYYMAVCRQCGCSVETKDMTLEKEGTEDGVHS